MSNFVKAFPALSIFVFVTSVCSGQWHLLSVLRSPTYWPCLTSSDTVVTASIWMTKPATQYCRCYWPPLTITLCSLLPQPLAAWKENSLLPFLFQRDFPGMEQMEGREREGRQLILGLCSAARREGWEKLNFMQTWQDNNTVLCLWNILASLGVIAVCTFFFYPKKGFK